LLKLHLGLIDALQQALATVDADVGKTLAPIEECARLLTTMPWLRKTRHLELVYGRHASTNRQMKAILYRLTTTGRECIARACPVDET
jgi:hypothetical protein